MKRMIFGLIALMMIGLLLTGCPEPVNPAPFDPPTVYIVGWYGTGISCYWVGATRTVLDFPSGSSAKYATGIAVENGSVYVSGYYNNGTRYVACWWKDGVRTDITSTSSQKAFDIAVDNGKVYLAGAYDYAASGYPNCSPCSWCDGTRTDLQTISGIASEAKKISVVGGTVYSAGYCNVVVNDVRPCLWTGSTKTEYADASLHFGTANDIALSAGSIYLAANYTNYMSPDCVGSVLQNGARNDYSVSGASYVSMEAVAVDGGIVFYAGWAEDSSGNETACVWKGSTCTVLPDENTQARALEMAVRDGHSFVAGYHFVNDSDSSYPCYWLDGTQYQLGSEYGKALDIALGE